MKTLLAAVLALGLSFGAAFAAGDHSKGPKGGIVEENGPLHVELVRADGAMTLYLYDGKMAPLASAKAKAKATVLANKKQTVVPLQAVEPNAFQASHALAAGSRLVVEVEMPGKRPVMVRFSVK